MKYDPEMLLVRLGMNGIREMARYLGLSAETENMFFASFVAAALEELALNEEDPVEFVKETNDGIVGSYMAGRHVSLMLEDGE